MGPFSRDYGMLYCECMYIFLLCVIQSHHVLGITSHHMPVPKHNCCSHTWAVLDVDLHDVIRRESVSLSKPIDADGAGSSSNDWYIAIYCKAIRSIVHKRVEVIWDTLHICYRSTLSVEVATISCWMHECGSCIVN